MEIHHHYHPLWGSHQHAEGNAPHAHSSLAAFDDANRPTTALQLREDIRAIMRAGGEVPAKIAERTWWPADLIREITEWHDAGRPDAALTAGMVRAGTYPTDATPGDIGPIIPSTLAPPAGKRPDPHKHKHDLYGWHRHRAKGEHLHFSRREFQDLHQCQASLVD